VRLLEHRLLVVVGKGGVGRTTCALALALSAAKLGQRVLVAELGGTDHLTRALGAEGSSYAPQTVAPGVDVMSLDAMDCLNDFGRRKLRLNRIVSLVLRSRIVKSFVDAVPGLHDLLQLGKLENLLNEPAAEDTKYDLCVLDAPATGHGVTLLVGARSMREMTRVGPFSDLARVIETFLAGPDCGIVPVTLLEDLPVQETRELIAMLEANDLTVAAVMANRQPADRLPDTPTWPEVRAAVGAQLPAAVLALADDAAAARAQHQNSLSDLRSAVPQTPIWVLPEVVSQTPARPIAEALVAIMEAE
jgi:anion-transporting  ArsA/GET3 family ATPase